MHELEPWSARPHGVTLEVATGSPPRTDIFLYRLADGAVIRLTADGAVNGTPTFWPAPR